VSVQITADIQQNWFSVFPIAGEHRQKARPEMIGTGIVISLWSPLVWFFFASGVFALDGDAPIWVKDRE